MCEELSKVQSSLETHAAVLIVMTCWVVVSQRQAFWQVWRKKGSIMKVEAEVTELRMNGSHLYFVWGRVPIYIHDWI